MSDEARSASPVVEPRPLDGGSDSQPDCRNGPPSGGRSEHPFGGRPSRTRWAR